MIGLAMQFNPSIASKDLDELVEQEEQEFDYLFGLEHEAEMDMIDARRDW